MPDDSPSADLAALERQLVAYLDGELDIAQRRQLEQRLASDARARRLLQELDRSWALLDALEVPGPDEQFTQTTLEMAALDASASEAGAGRPLARLHRRGMWFTAAMLAAAAAGFLLVAAVQSNPNRELLRDLPVLENLEQYQAAGDIEFLEMLHNEGLFIELPAEDER